MPQRRRFNDDARRCYHQADSNESDDGRLFRVAQHEGDQCGEPEQKPQLILIATGSEVELAIAVAEEVKERTPIRVVSMPCTERFDIQSDEYKESVLGKGIKRVAIEASHVDWWRKYVGLEGDVIGMDSFGESAPGNVLFEHFGFTKEQVISKLDL